MPAWHRSRVAEQLIEALIAVPLFAVQGDSMFHADPHAGNLLYDARTRELVILDWALTERLSHEQQRHLALLFLAISLRDPVGVCKQIQIDACLLGLEPVHSIGNLGRYARPHIVLLWARCGAPLRPTCGMRTILAILNLTDWQRGRVVLCCRTSLQPQS